MTETETETIPAVKVHVASISADVKLASPAPKRCRWRTTYETYILTANEPAQNILPQDPDRDHYDVIAIDNDIVLGPTKGVVAAPVNTVTNVPSPNGAYWPKGVGGPTLYDNGMVFAGATTTATISRITVIAAYYEGPE